MLLENCGSGGLRGEVTTAHRRFRTPLIAQSAGAATIRAVDYVSDGSKNNRVESAGQLEVVKIQRNRLAVLVVLNDQLTAALG